MHSIIQWYKISLFVLMCH